MDKSIKRTRGKFYRCLLFLILLASPCAAQIDSITGTSGAKIYPPGQNLIQGGLGITTLKIDSTPKNWWIVKVDTLDAGFLAFLTYHGGGAGADSAKTLRNAASGQSGRQYIYSQVVLRLSDSVHARLDSNLSNLYRGEYVERMYISGGQNTQMSLNCTGDSSSQDSITYLAQYNLRQNGNLKGGLGRDEKNTILFTMLPGNIGGPPVAARDRLLLGDDPWCKWGFDVAAHDRDSTDAHFLFQNVYHDTTITNAVMAVTALPGSNGDVFQAMYNKAPFFKVGYYPHESFANPTAPIGKVVTTGTTQTDTLIAPYVHSNMDVTGSVTTSGYVKAGPHPVAGLSTAVRMGKTAANSAGFSAYDTTGGTNVELYAIAANGKGQFGTRSNHQLNFVTNNQFILTLSSNRHVGFGGSYWGDSLVQIGSATDMGGMRIYGGLYLNGLITGRAIGCFGSAVDSLMLVNKNYVDTRIAAVGGGVDTSLFVSMNRADANIQGRKTFKSGVTLTQNASSSSNIVINSAGTDATVSLTRSDVSGMGSLFWYDVKIGTSGKQLRTGMDFGNYSNSRGVQGWINQYCLEYDSATASYVLPSAWNGWAWGGYYPGAGNYKNKAVLSAYGSYSVAGQIRSDSLTWATSDSTIKTSKGYVDTRVASARAAIPSLDSLARIGRVYTFSGVFLPTAVADTANDRFFGAFESNSAQFSSRVSWTAPVSLIIYKIAVSHSYDTTGTYLSNTRERDTLVVNTTLDSIPAGSMFSFSYLPAQGGLSDGRQYVWTTFKPKNQTATWNYVGDRVQVPRILAINNEPDRGTRADHVIRVDIVAIEKRPGLTY